MKKLWVFALSIVVLLILVTTYFTVKQYEKTNSTSKALNNENVLKISVFGDVHSNANALEAAIKDNYDINSKLDALVLNGDVVDEGIAKDYTVIKKCLDKNKKLLPKIIIKNIGNHEFFNYDKGENTDAEIKSFISRYLEFSGNQKVYHDQWIKGYHLISLGSEDTYSSRVRSIFASISNEQLKWMEDKLAENYTHNRPILVFLHQPLEHTMQENALKNILSKYSEVILFTSHLHTFLELDNIVYQIKPYIAVHTGAINRPIRWEGIRRTNVPGSQGIYVTIDGKKLVISGRDFKNRSWINDAVFTKNLSK